MGNINESDGFHTDNPSPEKPQNELDEIWNNVYKYQVEKDYDGMIDCLNKGIDKGCSRCINKLGLHYFETKDYDMMIKTYQIGIDKNDVDCMINIGGYYNMIEDYENMLKFNKMAINIINNKLYDPKILSNESAKQRYLMIISNLIKYYRHIHDTTNLILCHRLASCAGDETSTFELGLFYQFVNNFDQMNHFYNICIEKYKNINAMINMGVYYHNLGIENHDEAIRYYKMAIDREDEPYIDLSCILSAIMHLGNLYYIDGDDGNSLVYYEKGATGKYNDVICMLQVARLNYKLKMYANMIHYYKMFLSIVDDSNILFEYVGALGDLAFNEKNETCINELISIYSNETYLECYINYAKLRLVANINPYIKTYCENCYKDDLEQSIICICKHKYCIECFKQMIKEENYYCLACKSMIC